MTVIGVDFGTTNSVVTMLRPDGSVATVRHAFGTAEMDVIRSVLCFWNDGAKDRIVLRSAVGPAAIEAYLDDPLESRLMMSLKSYLAQRSFTETRVFGRPFTLEALIGLFLGAILPAPGDTRWSPGGRCGSPVTCLTTHSASSGCVGPMPWPDGGRCRPRWSRKRRDIVSPVG